MTSISTKESNGNRPLRVLVVDDDKAILRLVVTTLRIGGHVPLAAEHGRDGLAILDAVPPPDVVVLDLQMPEMDGRTFYNCARLCGYAGPVIICSAYGAEHARLELGAEASLTKPFDPEDLLSRINGLAAKYLRA